MVTVQDRRCKRQLSIIITVDNIIQSPSCEIMAVKLDISVLLEAVGAESYTQTLADHGVVTIEQIAALTEERLIEWGIFINYMYSRRVPIAIQDLIQKAKELLSSRDDVVQQELLVSGTSLVLGVVFRKGYSVMIMLIVR